MDIMQFQCLVICVYLGIFGLGSKAEEEKMQLILYI